jgi:hypothetical protein
MISTPEVERPGMRTTTDEAPELEIVEAMSSDEEPDPEATFVPPSTEKEAGGAAGAIPVEGPLPSSEPVAGALATIMSMVGAGLSRALSVEVIVEGEETGKNVVVVRLPDPSLETVVTVEVDVGVEEVVCVDVEVVPEDDVVEGVLSEDEVVVSVSPVEPVFDEVGGGAVFVPVPEEEVVVVDPVSPVEPVFDDVGEGELFVPVDPPVCPVLP